VIFHRRTALLAVAAAMLCAASVGAEDPEPQERGLHTREQTRLFQVDVSISGDPDVIQTLEPEDFKIKIGIHKLKNFILDRHCNYDDPAAIPAGVVREPPLRPLAANPGSFVFYFDQPHLTQRGRANALNVAHHLVRRLIQNGNRGMILSNSDRLVTFANFTEDRNELHEALQRLEADPGQLSPWASHEQARADEIVDSLNDRGSIEGAAIIARRHQQADRRLTEKNLNRLEQTLPRFAALPAPKAVIYFSDTTRMYAGKQYLSFFHSSIIDAVLTLSAMRTDALTARIAFDRVVHEASANGVRFYTIQAAGLTFDVQRLGMTFQGMALAGDVPLVTSDFTRMAQDTLASLATETGGTSFLNGPPADLIADKIQNDLACLYVVSFDPSPYSLDQPHRFLARVLKKGVRIHSRGQVVFQSDSRKLTNRLLGAFTAPGSDDPQVSVLESLIPLDYSGGEFKALLQVSVSGVPVAGARWDVGASVVDSRQEVSDASGQLTVSAPGAPLIFEKEMSFSPGPFQFVSVAHEHVTGLVASRRGMADWPRPAAKKVTLGPIAVVQPQEAVFVRDGAVRSSGSLALQEGRLIAPERPTALVSLVCSEKGRHKWDNTRVERGLTGSTDLSFPSLTPEPKNDRCIQVRDIIPAHVLTAGDVEYWIEMYREDRRIAATTKTFCVASSASHSE